MRLAGDGRNRVVAASSPRQQHAMTPARPSQQTWASRPSGVASTPPSPRQSSPAAGPPPVALPPLLDAVSPRREPLALSPHAAAAASASLQSTLERDYPVAQLDAWPLSSRASYKRPFAGRQSQQPWLSASSIDDASNSSSNHLASPISPRQRKTLQHRTLLDESKTKPLLLQELQAFVTSELAALAQQQRAHESTHPSDASSNSSSRARIPPLPYACLQRLQIFREAFNRAIAVFSAYAPVLAQIQDEYDCVIAHLRSECLQVPALHAQLQTLQTQCVHEIAAHSVDATARAQTQRRQLKMTQGRLTALAAQHAALQERNTQLEAQLALLAHRGNEMQLSNSSLVHGMKRHDETLRHVHERSREEALALASITSKYHHACDEIAELKKTIAALEERVVGGVHVAGDRATIALLTHDLQATHRALETALHTTSAVAAIERTQQLAHLRVLSHAFVRVLETQRVAVTLDELVAVAARSSRVDPTDAVVSSCFVRDVETDRTERRPCSADDADGADADADTVARYVLEKLAATQSACVSSPLVASSTTTATTFLTEEPAETLSLDAVVATQLLSTTDVLQGRGMSASVPEYLQLDGVVRNLRFSRLRVEQLVARVWQQRDDLDKAKRSHASVGGSSALAAPHVAVSGSNKGAVPLAKVLLMLLQRMCPTSKTDAIESAYNVVDALERYASRSSDCRLFLAVLRHELPESARQDQRHAIYALHDALAALEKDRSASSAVGSDVNDVLPPGRVALADVIQLLRQVYPWKTEAALSALHRALLLDQRGHVSVDYAALLLQQDDKRLGAGAGPTGGSGAAGSANGRSHLLECLRDQYIDDLLAYRRHLQSRIQQRLLGQSDALGETCSSSSALTARPVSESVASDTSASLNTSTHGAMVSIHALRDVLQECDVAKPVQEINQLLAVATALTLDQILTQDAMMVNAQTFLRKLPTLLVKPTGKFGVAGPGMSSANDDTASACAAGLGALQ